MLQRHFWIRLNRTLLVPNWRISLLQHSKYHYKSRNLRPPRVCILMGKLFVTSHNCVKDEEKNRKAMQWLCWGRCVQSQSQHLVIILRLELSLVSVLVEEESSYLQNEMSCFPLTPAIRFPANVSSWHSELIFFFLRVGCRSDSPRGTRLHHSLSVAFSLLRALHDTPHNPLSGVFHLYIHESPCDECPPSALVSRRSCPARFDRWKRNDPQAVALAFNLLCAVPNDFYGPAGLSSWCKIDMELACQQPTWVTGWKGCEVGLLSCPAWKGLIYVICSCSVAVVLQGGLRMSCERNTASPAATLQYWQFCQSETTILH